MTPTRAEPNGLKKYLLGVGISVTTAVVVQSGVLLWWAGSLTTRVDYMERHVDKNTRCVEQLLTSKLSVAKPNDATPKS